MENVVEDFNLIRDSLNILKKNIKNGNNPKTYMIPM